VPALDPAELTNDQKELRRVVHETISSANDDYGTRIHFNTVVSSVMSLMNQVVKFEDTSPQGLAVTQEAREVETLVMAPIPPHICQNLWQDLTGGDVNEALWPAVDKSALKKTVIEMVVQINGKVRAKFETAPDSSQAEIEAEARGLENVEKFLDGKTVRKVIVVPNKLVNFVVA
jgi:leucyl-tRNA synthetase